MNWSISAVLSAFSFGIQDTLSYKLLTKDKIGSAALNTMIHGYVAIVGLIIIFLLNFKKMTNTIFIIFKKYKLLIFYAGLAALLGNTFLYWSYQLGASINPGIITTISNGAIIISTILAYIFFNKKVRIRDIFGIIIILNSFLLLAEGNKIFKLKNNDPISIKNKKTEPEKEKEKFPFWIIIAILSAFSYGGLSFFQFILTEKDEKLNIISIAILIALIEFVIGIIIYIFSHIPVFEKFLQKGPFKNYNKDINKLFSIKFIPITLLSSLFNGTGLTTLLSSYKSAPNPGFSDTISDSYAIIQSILTWIFFKKKMDTTQIISIFISLIGIALISS